MNKTIALKKIVEFLEDNIIEIKGKIEDITISNIKATDEVDEDSLDWINPAKLNKQEIAEKSKAKVILCDSSVQYSDKIALEGKVLIHVKNPIHTLALVVEHFFIEKPVPGIHSTAIIHPEATIGENVVLGPFTYIGRSIIGDRTILLGNNFIDDNVVIGSDVIIQAGVVIGNEGHNYIRNENNYCIKFPHIGGVLIGDKVEIGSNTFVSRGVLGNTIIKEGTKIAQLVYIGANVQIGLHCAIRPNVMVSGSVVIGDYAILAPSSTIREHKSIGNNAFIGLSAVVTKNIPENETWIGNPAKKMEK